jgi:hypothetical protein
MLRKELYRISQQHAFMASDLTESVRELLGDPHSWSTAFRRRETAAQAARSRLKPVLQRWNSRTRSPNFIQSGSTTTRKRRMPRMRRGIFRYAKTNQLGEITAAEAGRLTTGMFGRQPRSKIFGRDVLLGCVADC